MEHNGPHFSWRTFLITSGVCGVLTVAMMAPELPPNRPLPFLVGFFIGAIIAGVLFSAIFLYFPILGIRKVVWSLSRKASKVEQLADKAHELQEQLEQDFFTTLVRINFKFLDAYYLQTQVQADKSFLMAATAAVVSLVVIVVGIITMFFGQMEPAKVTVATGALGEVMAGVFFYLYNGTIRSMGDYHRKLVLTQNVGLALKIAETLPESERVKAQEKLVENLVQDINVYLSGSSEKEKLIRAA